jgi:putative transposase
MREAAERYGVSIHAFVLMTNHVHILATPSTEKSVSRMMQSIGRRYVQYFNHIYSRTGTLWEVRYKSTLVDTIHKPLSVYVFSMRPSLYFDCLCSVSSLLLMSLL